MGKKRGSYHKKYRIPRQTIYNKIRKRALHLAVQISNTTGDALIDFPLSAVETKFVNETTIDAGTENEVIGYETDSNISLITLNDSSIDSSMDNSEDTSLQEETASTKCMLYKDSYLSLQSSELMIKSYVCRHHLSGQAQEDLLQLLQFHLPEGISCLPHFTFLTRTVNHKASL